MSRVLVLFHSYDEQTARIAGRMGEVLGQAGHAVTLRHFVPGEALEAPGKYDAVLVGAAVRYGHHDRALEKEVRRHAASLAVRPNAFFSVCMSAEHQPAVAQGYVDAFLRNTGWEPREAASFAGALRYRRYGFFIRLLMRLISGHAGGETDTSRDHEYTDWAAVDRFARAFAERITPASERTAA